MVAGADLRLWGVGIWPLFVSGIPLGTLSHQPAHSPSRPITAIRLRNVFLVLAGNPAQEVWR